MVRFSLGGIPVGVHASFLLLALFAASAYRGWDIVLWTTAAFVSILAHELGHGTLAKGFGARGVTITLYGLGGLTSYRAALSHGRSFLVSAAGSAVGIALGGALWLASHAGLFAAASPELRFFLDALFYTSLWWGVLNWIPIVPLDGGHMLQSLAAIVNEERAPLIAQVVTWIAVAIVIPVAWVSGYGLAAIFVVAFALMGLREYREATMARKAPRVDGGEGSVGDPTRAAGDGSSGSPTQGSPNAADSGDDGRPPPAFPI